MSRIFSTSVAVVYPQYVAKAEKKGRTQGEVDAVIRGLTGFDEATLRRHLADGTTFEEFFAAQAHVRAAQKEFSNISGRLPCRCPMHPGDRPQWDP